MRNFPGKKNLVRKTSFRYTNHQIIKYQSLTSLKLIQRRGEKNIEKIELPKAKSIEYKNCLCVEKKTMKNEKRKTKQEFSSRSIVCVCVVLGKMPSTLSICDINQIVFLSFFRFLFLVAVVRISFSSLFNELQLKYRHGEYRWWWWWWDEYRDFSFTHSLFLFLDNKWSLMFWSIRFLFIRFVSFFFRLMIIMNYRFSSVFFCIEGLIFSDRFFCCCFDSRLNSNGEWFFSVFFVFWCKSYIIVTWW